MYMTQVTSVFLVAESERVWRFVSQQTAASSLSTCYEHYCAESERVWRFVSQQTAASCLSTCYEHYCTSWPINLRYPLVNLHSYGKSQSLAGKSTINVPCSIAVLDVHVNAVISCRNHWIVYRNQWILYMANLRYPA
jgi:hypothetical protein